MDAKSVHRWMTASLVTNLVASLVMGIASVPSVHAQAVAVSERPEAATPAHISIDVVDAPLVRVLGAIAHQARLNAFWNDKDFNAASRVTLHMRDEPVDLAFVKALSGTGMQAKITLNRVEIIKDGTATSFAQGTITGTIVDAKTKHPIRDAVVTLDGATKGTTSSDDGAFRLSNVVPGQHTIHVRLLGYHKAVTTVTVLDGQAASVVIAMEPSVNALDQVVVTGTVTPTALKAVPNAITVITGQELEQRGITRIDQLFRGDVPGLWAINLGTGNLQPGQLTAMTSRGMNNMSTLPLGQSGGTYAMKTYVDGVELADARYLALIDPRSIERIEILSGPQASTIYGEGAIMGVMQVFTKRGTTARPQLTMGLLSGVVQNDFSEALTPQHDYSAQISQTTGTVSYNVGGSWTRVGPWSPAVHQTTTSGFGGARLQEGPLTADVSFRRTLGSNWQNGVANQHLVEDRYNGFASASPLGYPVPVTWTSSAQSLGATVTYTPMAWWSHTVTVGSDGTNSQNSQTAASHLSASDTTLVFNQTNASSTNVSYSTTAQLPMGSVTNLVLTGGADGYHTLAATLTGKPIALTGNGVSSTSFSVNRTPTHAHGAFLQGQLGVWDAMFFTVGVRADWNPTYGADVNPNVVPRYGIAITHDLGPVTAKVRMSYGHSTRPPQAGAAEGVTKCVDDPGRCVKWAGLYGPNAPSVLANPALVPEQQKGGEGGLELYFGGRGTLVITRYNQTVNNLIFGVPWYSDSLRSLQPLNVYNPFNDDPNAGDGYSYLVPYKSVNLGDVRNAGWELQGTVNVGPITAKGTYSWTKSRVIDLGSPIYQTLYGFVPGGSFSQLPEHTYGIEVRYAYKGTTVSYDLQGQGAYLVATAQTGGLSTLSQAAYCMQYNKYAYAYCPSTRVRQLHYISSGYANGGDINAAQRFSSHVDGVLQIQNLRDTYQLDNTPDYATIGRQTKIGVRIRY